MSKQEKQAILIGAGVVLLIVALLLWYAAYKHTTPGARFGCWPEPAPKWVPQFIRDWLDIYCGS